MITQKKKAKVYSRKFLAVKQIFAKNMLTFFFVLLCVIGTKLSEIIDINIKSNSNLCSVIGHEKATVFKLLNQKRYLRNILAIYTFNMHTLYRTQLQLRTHQYTFLYTFFTRYKETLLFQNKRYIFLSSCASFSLHNSF